MQRTQTPHRTIRHLRWTGLMMSLSFCFPSLAFAAITTDGTVGLATNLAGPNYAIPASLGSQVGGNLFHSFSVFNINTGESATFSGPNNVSNIIARVTGGSLSTIDGGLNSTIPQANLILINPSGVVFGPNASLDVGGSFYASTANYVRLADGGKFDATTPANSVLTTAPLVAFGFLGPVAPISVHSNLAVAEGKTLSLIGGGMDVTGSLKALGGNVNIASVASAGEVGLVSGLDVASFTSLGAISLDAPIDVSAGVISGSGTTGQAGSIYIRGGQITTGAAASLTAYTSNLAGGNIDIRATGTLTMKQSLVSTDTKGQGLGGSINLHAASMVLDKTSIYADALGSGHGGNVSLDAGSMILDNAEVYADTWNAGNAGNVTITANQLEILNGTWISSDALRDSAGNGTGNGGLVDVTVTGVMKVANGQITTTANGEGIGGNINIHADGSILLGGGAKIKSDSTWDGKAGSISITTPELNVDGGTISSKASDWGMGGNIDITVDKLILANSGTIDVTTSSLYTHGTGGNINIEATTSIDLSGGAQIKSDSTGKGNAGSIVINNTSELNVDGGTISSTASGWGNGGYIDITVDKLTLSNGGTIDTTTSSSNSSGAGGYIWINASHSVVLSGFETVIKSDNKGDAEAGFIWIEAPELSIDGGNINSKAWGGGKGGLINIIVDNFALFNQGWIDIGAFGSGAGGYAVIEASQSIDLSSGATIWSDSNGSGRGGYVSLKAPVINIDGGEINARSTGSGGGGDILFEVDELNIDGGKISSKTVGAGKAGWIYVNAGNVVLANSGTIDAGTSGAGNGGDITINAAASIALSNGALISSKSTGGGTAGQIYINAGRTFTSENSSITTEAKQSKGGVITLMATDLIYLNYGDISTSVGGGAGNGGDIFIDPQFAVLNNSNIAANAIGGNGGNINMVASNFFRSANSTITATSKLGLPGTVSLNAQLTDLSGSLADLPMVYLDATGLIKQRCAAQLEGNISTFVTSGRGGIPHEPGNLMPSASLLANGSGPQAGAGGMQYASLSGCAN